MSKEKTESRRPESIDVLCKRLESASERNSGTRKGVIYSCLYDKLLGEYKSVREGYFKMPDLVDETTPGYVETNRQLMDVFRQKIMEIDGKVFIVGHDNDGVVGIRYENSYSEAIDTINRGNSFNGPVIWYRLRVASALDKKTNNVVYLEAGYGRILLRPWIPQEPQTEPYLPAVKGKDTSHILVAAR